MSGKLGVSNRQLAIALRYDADLDASPRVIAKGKGKVAEKIISLAQDQGIPVRSDPDLAHLLTQLDVGSLIPPELYPAVAEILAYIYKYNQNYRNF